MIIRLPDSHVYSIAIVPVYSIAIAYTCMLLLFKSMYAHHKFRKQIRLACMVDAWLVGLCSILGYYMTTSHSTHTQHNKSTQHIKWLAEFMQCLSCSCLALCSQGCLESWSQGEGTEGLFLGLSSSCSTRGGAYILQGQQLPHQIQRFSSLFIALWNGYGRCVRADCLHACFGWRAMQARTW